MNYAVQLYSVRDCIQNGEDFLRVLGDVKACGYDGVEFAGTFGVSADQLKNRLDELGLTAVGAHLSVDDFSAEHLEDTIQYYQTLGCRQIGVGGAPTSTEEDLTHVLSVLGAAEKVCAEQGMHVYFHNHTGEFRPTSDGDGSKTILDRLKEVCYLQIDTYWSFVAGIDNASFLRENQERILLLHLKDGVDSNPCAIGEGQNDIKTVMDAAKDLGMEWVIVENDDPVPDGLSDIRRSIDFLKNNF